MDLKIKDVAELLNVSETTIRRWIGEGKIPVYRLNHQYRFSRIEIENWVMSCKVEQAEAGFLPFPQEQAPLAAEPKEAASQRSGLQQFSLYRAIHQGGVLSQVVGETKEEVIRGTTKLIAQCLDVDGDVLTELLLDREELMPTALNNGIAVPHTRDFFLQGRFDMVFVVYPQRPIEYGALDGKPVHTLFFLFSNEDKRHLHLLAKLAHLSSSEGVLEMLRAKPSKNVLLDHIREWEGLLRGSGAVLNSL
jgi:PTS system nitrogen regulatory IIA component